MKNTQISVVIPFYNAKETLGLCLANLCKQSVKPDEIILVDNDSDDCSKEIVESFVNDCSDLKIIYLLCEKPGPSAARNKGVDTASGDWIIFTDSDCIPSLNWVSDYTTHFNNEKIGAVAGCIKPYTPTNMIQKTLSLFTLPENEKDVIHDDFTIDKGLYPTANLAVRREVFESVGGFNVNLKYGEDHELCAKIYRAGHKIKATKNAAVEHIHRKNLSEFLKQSFRFGTAHPFEVRHLSSGRFIFVIPYLKVNRVKKGTYVWIDLNQADKKVLGFILLGLIWWPLYILGFVYCLHLCFFIRKMAKNKGIRARYAELPFLTSLLILKSFCLTAGRISHSLKYRVFCL